jgi:hypothetical protein
MFLTGTRATITTAAAHLSSFFAKMKQTPAASFPLDSEQLLAGRQTY